MSNQTISVTFFQEGAVRLLRTAKKVGNELTSNIEGTTFTCPADQMSHDVQAYNMQCTRKIVLEPETYMSIASGSELRSLGIHGRDRKKVARNWAALPTEQKINANLKDLAHDFGAVGFEWFYL